jgi:hypothetical protein
MKRNTIWAWLAAAAVVLWAATALMMVTGCGPAEFDDFEDPQQIWPGGKADFTAAQSVLLIPLNHRESNSTADFESDDNCFYDSAMKLKSFFNARGASARVLITNTPDYLAQKLDEYAGQGVKFDRVIFISHGTSNGPTFCCGYAPQIGWDFPKRGGSHQYVNQSYLHTFGEKLNAVTRADGWIYVGACNAGTDGTSIEGFSGMKFIDVISCKSGRVTYGVATKTACWDVVDRVKKLEQGISTSMLRRSSPQTLPEELVCYGETLPPPPPPEPDAGVEPLEPDAGPPAEEPPAEEPPPEEPPPDDPPPDDPWDDWGDP